MPRELTLKQRKFIDAYLGEANGNGTEAARVAGYSCPMEQAYENLRKPQIRAEIDRRLDDAGLSPKAVTARIAAVAKGSLADVLEIDEKGYRLDMMKAKRSGAIRTIRTVRATQFGDEVRLHDPLKALVILARIHGLLADPGAPPEPEPMEPAAADRIVTAFLRTGTPDAPPTERTTPDAP